MKLLEINSVCGIRSTGRICTDIADILLNSGHECRIAYGRVDVPDKYRPIAYRIGNKGYVGGNILKARLFDNDGFNAVGSTKKLINWICEYDPDVIHLHNIHGYYINVEELFKYLKTSGKRIIWTLHDCWAFTGHCAHFADAGCEQWKSHCDDCRRGADYPNAFFKARAYRNFEKKKEIFTGVPNMTLVTPSRWLAGLVKQSYLKEYDISVIPNGVDLEHFKPIQSDFKKKYGIENKKMILGVATAWTDKKGLSAFCKLASKIDDRYKIVLVGLTKKQLLRLPQNILAIERTNSIEELAEIYTAADVFLNLSREETMGLTTVEAMACGTPVVVSNLTAVPEVVRDYGGIVIDNIDTDTILKGISVVVSGDYHDTIKNANEYEKTQQYNKYIELYKK